MARVDSILNLVDRQGADELRLGSDREPQMFAAGAQKRLVIPKTSTETLRELLGELLPPARESDLVKKGRVEFAYDAGPLGAFHVTLTRRGDGSPPLELDVMFTRGRKKIGDSNPGVSAPVVQPAPSMPVNAARPAAPAATPITHTARAEPPPQLGGGEWPPTAELVALVQAAGRLRASDLHLASHEVPALRVDGRIVPLANASPVDLDALLGPALAAEAQRRFATGASADLAVSVEGVGRVRVNVYRTALGQAAALRLFPPSPPALADLDLPVPLDDLVDLPHGLVLVTGPSGSGKSTTLAALAQAALRRRAIVLLTLEDPIEYVLGGAGSQGLVRQRQIGRDVGDFAAGLRDALREDPDVLLIGEMRDPETIALALTAAETGHLVLASLHSRSAASAIERIVDTYAPARQHQIRVQVAEALRVVVAQRLVPRASGQGRAVALEVLRVTHGVANAIREGKTSTITSAMQAGKKDGMLPLERCLADFVERRIIDLEVARAAANDVGAFAQYLSG